MLDKPYHLVVYKDGKTIESEDIDLETLIRVENTVRRVSHKNNGHGKPLMTKEFMNRFVG
jgi:hypothetical protein